MKVVLTVPFNRRLYLSNPPLITPPLGLGYIASWLKIKGGHNVLLYNANKDGLPEAKSFYEFLTREKPQLVGIQLFSFDLAITKEYLRCVKKISKDIITVIGGPHASALPDETMVYFGSDLDFVIVGEGEKSLCALADCIEDKQETWNKIPGLVWRNEEGKILKNNKEFIQDLNELPWPDWELINPRSYPISPFDAFSKYPPATPILVSRGCPVNCNFCAVKVVCGNQLRYRNIDDVIAEVKYLKDRFGVREITIQDDNFTFSKKIAMEFCQKVLPLNMRWNCLDGLRLDSIDDELVKTMKGAGCHTAAVGIESGSQKILNDMNKKLKIEIISDKISILAKHKIHISGLFILGYPTETREDIIKTIELANKLPISRASYSSFIPLPGSAIYYELRKQGKMYDFENLSYCRITESFTPHVSKLDLELLMKKAIRSFYMRPLILLKILREVTSFFYIRNLIKRFIKSCI